MQIGIGTEHPRASGVIRQNGGDQESVLRTKGLLPLWRRILVDEFTVMIENFGDRHRRDAHALIRHHGECTGHLKQADFAAAERQGKTIIIPREGGDAETLGHGNHAFFFLGLGVIIDADKVEGFHCRDIEGVRQRHAQGDRSVKTLVVVDGFIGFSRIVGVARRREFGGHVPDQGAGSPAFFEGCQIGDRLDRGAGLTGGAGRHIDLP